MEDDDNKDLLEQGKLSINKTSGEQYSSEDSDGSLSLSPPLLPENLHSEKTVENEAFSDSSISEHLNSNSDSIENDRSDQEIEVSNLPCNVSLLQEIIHDDEVISSKKFDNVEAQSRAHSILEEILKSDHFKLDSERTLQRSDFSLDSSNNSFNIFDGVNLNDSLIHNYEKNSNKSNSELSSANLSASLRDKHDEGLKVKQLEELLNVKESTIVALTAELESLKEITSSNQSASSFNTSTTDYKYYQDEFQNKVVEFQNALAHRDSVIQQLTEALQQSVINREELAHQSEYFSQEIIKLKNQLFETTEILSQNKSNLSAQKLSITNVSVQNANSPINANDSESCSMFSNEQPEGDGDQSVLNYELQCSKLEETLNEAQINLMNDLKEYINSFVLQKTSKYKNAHENELKILQDKLEKEKMDYETEIGRLKNLLTSIQGDSIEFVAFRAELESKHAKEMEELRTYFEKKCVDLEKNYSEEIFSQQSRKMSGSSSCSETSEFMYSNTIPHSGPGGDTVRICVDATKYECSDLNKNDVIKLKANLSAISVDLNKYDFKNITKEDVDNIKLELKKYDFRGLLKYDLSLIKAEIQNKYHAELEILREDYENRIDTLHVEHSNRLQITERRYTDQIESLKFDLDQAIKNMNVNTVPSVASSGDFELTEVVESYERRLQEQVNMAKIDIINALEHQIQILVTTPVEDTEWPAELLQLKNKFTEKYENDIRVLNEKHEEEVIKLKEEHRKNLTGTIARAKRRSIADESQSDLDVIKERDNLKKTTTVLRHLIGELMNYFSECEQELNNTIVEELLKHGFDKDLTELEVEINLNESSTSTYSDSVTSSLKKKVHIAPKFDELMATIDNSIPSSLDSNISIDLKNELGACLKRLRDDANAILAASNNKNEPRKSTDNAINEVDSLIQVKLNSLTEQLVKENQVKKELVEELEESKHLIQNLEVERVTLETQVEELISQQKVFESDLNKAKEKISELIENGHKEIVSEGYGKKSSINLQSLGSRVVTLSELQERVRSMVVEINDRPDNPLSQVVEELCREGDRITEEAKNDHDDLQQQIDAADKKLRATCKFLEEQASEREQERDEAQKEIVSLQEQLKERDRDRVSCERINKEIEHLEQQMREMTKLMDENERKTKEIELEKKEAIDKIYVLRDIIRDLETQVETKTSSEAELQAFISQLENIIKQQNKTNEELTQNLSSVRNISEAEDLQEIVKELESEIKALKLNLEFAGNEGLFKQIKTELNEFELNIDKCTRDLEALHSSISTTSCSSPSEDMSVRDQICSKTPLQSDDCEVPLQQLARLKEKLVKHSRAEGAAVKRIRDLEMEVAGIRHDLDDVQNERDLLQDQVSEQLVLVSSLQMRLDDQRLRAEQFQKQTNNSLEMRIYDLENEVKSLVDSVNARDKTIKHMTKTVEDTKKRLSDREEELHTNLDAQIITELHNEIQKLRSENESLLVKMNKDAQSAQVLPNLVDNILADKNKDIDMLRDKLDRTQSELNTFLSLNLDHEQLKALSRLHSSERAFSDILSLIEPENIRAEKLEESLSGSMNPEQYKRNSNETTILGPGVPYQPDFSTIENLQKSRNYESTPLPKSNSTEIPKSSEKRVHFNDSVYGDVIDKLQAEITDLKNELYNKEEIINEFTDRLKILKDLEIMIEKLQQKLDSTEESLEKTTKTFEKEQKESRELQKNLGVELAEKKMNCIDLEKKLELLEEDSTRKDQMYINLAKEKRDIEKVLNQLKENNEHYKKLDVVVSENESEILSLREQLSSIGNHIEKIRSLEVELDLKNLELTKLQEEVDSKSNSLEEYKQKLLDSLNENKEKDEFNSKLQKDIKNKESQLDLLNSKVENLQETIEGKNKQIEDLKVNLKQVERTSLAHLELKIKELKNIVLDRETEIEILNEDTVRYQDDLANLENKLKTVKDSVAGEYELKLAQGLREVAAKELKIVKIVTDLEDYEREINHLRGIVNEKDKIINQMSVDTKSLHVNLETIQTKMQESGNVVDLKKRLEEEQQLNSSLREEIDSLKSFNIVDTFKSAGMSESVEAIAGEVKKQLDYSDHLDSNILNALGACDNLGSLAQSNDINLLKQTLSKEMYLHQDLKNKKESLEIELLQLKNQCKVQNDNVLVLKELLEKEKENSNTIQLEDANMIEQLHTRLSRALENENEFEKLLDFEKRGRQNLEIQLESLTRRISNMSSENSKTELTEYKSLPNPDSMELLKLRSEIQALHKENSTMKTDLKNLKRGKSDLEAHLKYIDDMLKFKNEELEKIRKEVETIKESEINAQTNLYSCKVELEQRTKEVENSRALMAEFEADSVQMRNQISRLQDNLNKSSNMQGDLNNLVPEKFVNKIKELTGSLKEYAKNNKEMSEIVDKLTTERTILQERVSELEQLNNMKLPYDDPVGKVNHLFARYLRSDSYRKALIWQKRYLVALLATYQTRPLFSTEIPVPYQNNAVANHRHISSGKQRFKAVAVGVIAVIRMQYLVRRWNSGKRGFHYGRPYRTHSSASGAKFQVGKPVSSQYFPISQVLTPTTSNTPNAAQSKVPTRNPSNQNFIVQNYQQVSESNDENLLSNESRPRTPTNFYTLQTTWSGATPPSRDQQSHFNIANPLIAPALLSQCLDGFDEVKHRLGMSIDKKSTTRVSE